MVCLYGSLVNGFELISMTDRIVARQDERRNGVRFPANVPLTVLVGDRMIAGYTRDLSDKGVYFYLGSSESDLIGGEFSFTLKLPPKLPSQPGARSNVGAGWRAERRNPQISPGLLRKFSTIQCSENPWTTEISSLELKAQTGSEAPTAYTAQPALSACPSYAHRASR